MLQVFLIAIFPRPGWTTAAVADAVACATSVLAATTSVPTVTVATNTDVNNALTSTTTAAARGGGCGATAKYCSPGSSSLCQFRYCYYCLPKRICL